MTRRIYDFAAHARTFKRFKSWMPLIVDSNDPFQIYPRMPRIYDPVEVYDEEQSGVGIVRHCRLQNVRAA